MYIQAWKKEDGSPSLFSSEFDIPENFTRIPPEDGLFDPIYFEEASEEWVGSEPPKIDNVIPPLPEPEQGGSSGGNSAEELLAQLMLENTILQFSIEDTRNRVELLESIINDMNPKETDEENSLVEVEEPKEEENGNEMPEV